MYSADLITSEWKVSESPFACSLTHVIPGFGKAIFARKAAGVESMYLETQGKVVFPAGAATIETLPPQWRSDLTPVVLGSLTATAGTQPIHLTSAEIALVVSQLAAGVNVMHASQAFANVSSSSAVMRVVLNAKNFAAGYQTYQKCIADIIPYNFAQVARTFINYPEKATGLSAANKSELHKVARYVKADPKVVGVFVDGHSDNSGTAETREAQSRQAAEWVSAYLTEQGIGANKITTRWHADKFLIANNKTDGGRAQNRRVTVRLEDESAHKEFMKKEEETRKANEKAASESAGVDAEKSKTAATSSSTSSTSKMSPEEISRMVEGYDPRKDK
jgi:outer membrane protein OmpA-like peptidoglycan-associated protein